MIHENIAVKTGADDLMVSENDMATYLRLMREHTTEANLESKEKCKSRWVDEWKKK